jgi:homopolymeric O-antigen transport system ATP-binding protein
MKENIVISADRLGKRYHRLLRSARHRSLRDALAAGVGALVQGGHQRAVYDTFWALQDASFQIARGENIGIIGPNGAGKSTLLKILSRIVTPTVGYARVTGRVGALLEVGTGFHWELTGRENTFLYGAILGMSRAEIARKYDAIVDFSEMADFMNTPVKRYSSGMFVRLAFAVAAHLNPDILLLDEVLAVGDLAYQRKCLDFARDLERSGSTILFVSHNMFSIRIMCQRVLYLKQGRIIFDGPTDEGLRLYETDSRLSPASWFNVPEDRLVVINDIELFNQHGEHRTIFEFGELMRIRIRYRALQPIEDPHFLISITRSDGVLCCNFSSYNDKLDLPRISGDGVIELVTPPLKLVSDRYTVDIAVRERGFKRLVGGQVGMSFHLRHDFFDPDEYGVFHEPGQWQLEAAHGEVI